MDIAFLYPGQGEQTPAFLHRLPEHPKVTATLDEASGVLGTDARTLDSEAALTSTIAVQLSGLIAGVAVTRAFEAEGVQPDSVAGLSSGAYTAAVACGALDFPTALTLLKLRAGLMERAYPRGFGLAALVGLDEVRVRWLIAEVGTRDKPLYIGNLNAPRQIVLAGGDAALEVAVEKQGLPRTAELRLVDHAHGALANFREELDAFLHGFILSRVGVSSKPGVVQASGSKGYGETLSKAGRE